jgi:BlaI family penicillinase repressor
MAKPCLTDLSRRERQVMDVLYREGEATAERILELVPDPPSYSAIRSILRILEEKGFAGHGKRGRRYLYRPSLSPERAKRSALEHVMKTFFDNSPENVVAALIDVAGGDLSDDDLSRMARLIEKSRNEACES